MPLTAVGLVLDSKLPTRTPDIVTLVVLDFLVADITITEACQLSHVGSTLLLDLVWMRSARDDQRNTWNVAKLLQSERHYYRWVFSQALIQGVRRGDLVMVQWLLTHFFGCPVSNEVVEEAAKRGGLWVLQLLEGGRRHGGIVWSERSADLAAKSGNWELVRWLLKRTGSTRETRRANDTVVDCAFEQNNLAHVKWAIGIGYGVRSIAFPDCSAVEWQGRAEILRFLLEEGHVPVPSIVGVAAYRAARFGDLDFIKWLASLYMDDVDVQYWTHALENASEGGHLSVVEWILVHVDGIVRANGPSEAMLAAAECGKLEVVQWLYKQYRGKLSVDLFQERVMSTKFIGVNDLLYNEDLEPTTAMDAAAKNGHLGVLQFLDGVDAASRNKQKKRGGKSMPRHQRGHYPSCTTFAMDAAAALGHLNVVKWLHSHRLEGCTTEAMDRAAGNGHLDVVQWLHSHRSEGCTAIAMDSAASRRFHVASCDCFRSSVCCLDMRPRSFCDKQLAMLQWLLLNRTERCTTAAMDGAVKNGDFKLMQWLHMNTTAGCSTETMDCAVRLGRLDLVQWLHQNYPEVRTPNVMHEAARQGCLEVVKWLYEDASEEAEAKSIQRAAARGHLHLVQWLVSRCTNARAILSAMQLAISSEHFEVILLLDSQLMDHYNEDDLQELRYGSFAFHDIRHWFNEKYPPSSQ